MRGKIRYPCGFSFMSLARCLLCEFYGESLVSHVIHIHKLHPKLYRVLFPFAMMTSDEYAKKVAHMGNGRVRSEEERLGRNKSIKSFYTSYWDTDKGKVHRLQISETLEGRTLTPEHIHHLSEGALNSTIENIGRFKPGVPYKYNPTKKNVDSRRQRAITRNTSYEGRDSSSRRCIAKLQKAGGLRSSKADWYTDRLGRKRFLRSSWEIKFAQWLDSKLLTWDYESEYFLDSTSEEVHRYLPDFYIKELDSYIEIKPMWRIEQAYDLKRLIECVYNKKLLIVTEDELQDLDSWYSNLISTPL